MAKPKHKPHCKKCGEDDPTQFYGRIFRRCKYCLKMEHEDRVAADPEKYVAIILARREKNKCKVKYIK